MTDNMMHEKLANRIRWTLADIRAQMHILSPRDGGAVVDEALLGATQEALKRRKRGLERLLERLGEDGFDTCEECGEPIGVKRMLAVPETRLCFGCKSLREEVWPMRTTARF